jgi:hypothetical protein
MMRPQVVIRFLHILLISITGHIIVNIVTD